MENGNGNLTTLNGGSDPYMSYAAKNTTVDGLFLTFKNGEFLYGQDATTLQLGTKLVANMPGLMSGWRRWWGGKVSDERMELVSAFIPMPSRESLGDLDEALWELDERTRLKRDPWMKTSALQLLDEKKQIYIYSTGSKGGIGAIAKLCKAYAQEYRQRPNMLPIVEITNDSYMHAMYGKTYFPVFSIVGWTPGDNPSTKPAPAVASGKGKNNAAATDPSDDIPF